MNPTVRIAIVPDSHTCPPGRFAVRRIFRHYRTCRTGTVSPPPPVRFESRNAGDDPAQAGFDPERWRTAGLPANLGFVLVIGWLPKGGWLGDMEGSRGSAGRFAAWLLKQGSGASASGPCWFCGALSTRPSWRHLVPVTHLVQAGYCSRPGKRLYRRLRSLRLAVQDAALSRQKQGFDSPREYQLFQWVSGLRQAQYPKCPQVCSRIRVRKRAFSGHGNCRSLMVSRD